MFIWCFLNEIAKIAFEKGNGNLVVLKHHGKGSVVYPERGRTRGDLPANDRRPAAAFSSGSGAILPFHFGDGWRWRWGERAIFVFLFRKGLNEQKRKRKLC